MAPKWPMRQNSSAKTALNTTEGVEIQGTCRPSEDYRAEEEAEERRVSHYASRNTAFPCSELI